MRRFTLTLVVVGLAAPWAMSTTLAADESPTFQKHETFDREPAWESVNNRLVPERLPTIVQDFGYSATGHAGRSPGELGGLITRASAPAYYADRIEPRTLDDKLHASGTFALTKTTPGGGAFFGFFRAAQPGGGGRPIASLGMNLDCEATGGRLAVRLITGENQSCGTFITPYLPGKYRPTPLRNDGTRYDWTLDYDPAANDGRGRFTFTLAGAAHDDEPLEPNLSPAAEQEARDRFPHTKTFTVDLPEGYRQQATTFDHFGLMNMMKAGGTMQIFCDDLAYVGKRQDFGVDPQWDGAGNRRTYQDEDVTGRHNFGFSPTNHAGGDPGEVGGKFWRTEANIGWGRYADRIGAVTMSDRLEARGKVHLVVGGPDADMCFGWFRTEDGAEPPNRAGEFLGIKIGGPTRVGHYFLPTFTINEGLRGLPDRGPILRPGRTYEWSLAYDPAGGEGRGTITATLGDESVVHELKPGQKEKAAAARFDRFGLFSVYPGGQIVHVYIDDLEYSARR